MLAITATSSAYISQMPRYFFDVEDGHRLFDATGFFCDNDTDALIKAAVLAIGVAFDKPEVDPERRIAVINDQGRDIGRVPVYSKPSLEHPAKAAGSSTLEDYQASIEKLRKDAAEAALIRDLATDKTKRDMYDRLHRHLSRLADEVDQAVKSSAAE